MDDLAGRAAAAIEQVCPIRGLRIGRADDKQTWQIAFADEATKEQREAAAAAIAAFDLESPASWPKPPASVADDLAALKAALIEDGVITEAKIDAAKRDRRQSSF